MAFKANGPNGQGGAGRGKSAHAQLTPADSERLKSWMPEIADQALGDRQEEPDGSLRFGKRALILHPNGFFYNFAAVKGGAGGVDLLAMLHDLTPEDAIARAHEWLRAHFGFGSLSDDAEDKETREAKGNAERIAFIASVWGRTVSLLPNTLGWAYLTTARELMPAVDDLEHLRWLPYARGNGPDAEGAMVAALTNNLGGLEALQLTYITAAGVKSAINPARRTYKGAHDWSRRGLLRFGPVGSPKAFIVEGVEDGLSLRQAGAERVLVLCGLYRLGKVALPFELETAAVVRDADTPETAGVTALWKGVVRLACQLPSRATLLVTTRPDAIGAKAKDVNDLIRLFGVDKVEALMKSAQKIPPFSEFERAAIIEEACSVGHDSYADGRERIASLIEWRKADLDNARKTRIKEKANANQAALAERDQPWPDPVPDITPLLDEIVTELARYVVAPLPLLHTVALWIVFAHLVHREDLKINISPRLAIQAPDKNCGKSVLLEAVACAVPRPDLVSSTSASATFRSIQNDKPTLLIDEVDLLLVGGRNPELHEVLNGGHRRATAWVKRVERKEDGSLLVTRFNCFAAIATAGIKELPGTLQDRSIVIFMQRAIAGEVKEHLIDAESEALITIRRKLIRWAEDLRELPAVNRSIQLANRRGDNWYPLRQIAALAGEEWKRRSWEAAIGSVAAPASIGALTELLEAVWRVFWDSKQPRMLTQDIVTALLDLDEDKWRYVNNSRQVTTFYVRDLLKDVIPHSKELDRARRWRPSSSPSGNPQWGFTKDHLKEAWLRYPDKKPPGLEEDEERGDDDEQTPKSTEKQESNRPRGAHAGRGGKP